MLSDNEHNTEGPRRKRLSMSQLGSGTQLEIAKLAAAKHLTHKEIADLHKVGVSVVSRISSSLKQSLIRIVKRLVPEQLQV